MLVFPKEIQEIGCYMLCCAHYFVLQVPTIKSRTKKTVT